MGRLRSCVTNALVVSYNDVLYNGRGSQGAMPKPLFTFTGGVARVNNTPLDPSPSEEPAAAPPTPRGSAALAWAREHVRRTRPRADDALATLGLWPEREREDPGVELQVYSRRPPRVVNDAWAFTVHLLRELAAAVRERGARLLVAYIPTKLEVRDADWELTQMRYGVDDTVWDRGRLARLFLEVGRQLGFPVLDLTPDLVAADRSLLGGPYHPMGAIGTHWATRWRPMRSATRCVSASSSHVAPRPSVRATQCKAAESWSS